MNGPRIYDVIDPPTSLGVSQRAHEAFSPGANEHILELTLLGQHAVPKPEAEVIEMTIQRITERQDGTRAILGRSAVSELVLIETAVDHNEKATATLTN